MYNITEVIYHMGTNFKNLICLIEKMGGNMIEPRAVTISMLRME